MKKGVAGNRGGEEAKIDSDSFVTMARNGVEYEFVVVLEIECDDGVYAFLAPAHPEEMREECADDEIFVYKVVTGEDVDDIRDMVPVDDDALIAELMEIFNEAMSE